MVNDVSSHLPRRSSAISSVARAIIGAVGDVMSPELRQYLWRSLGLTMLLLLGAGAGLSKLISWFANQSWLAGYPYISMLAVFLAGIGIFIGLIFLIPPVSAVVASYYLDDVAEIVEKRCAPNEAVGVALPLWQSLLSSLRFALLSLGLNLLALFSLLIAGIGFFVFIGVNTYLFGREYFELAAVRYQPVKEARKLRNHNNATVLLGGIVIALFVMIPLLNLVTPLFGTALMVRIHKSAVKE